MVVERRRRESAAPPRGKDRQGRDVIRCDTIDHGQVVGYTADRPVETAQNAITRVVLHSEYGFGELRGKPFEARNGKDPTNVKQEHAATISDEA